MPRAIFIMLLVLLPALSAGAEPLDQHGVAQRWKGPSDQYTVIDFAASWCRPCWGVLPKLEAYAREHPRIRVVVVDVDEKVSGRNALVEKLGLTIPVVWDADHEIAEHYQPARMPATFVLDPAGEVVYSHVGSAAEAWERMVAFLEKATAR